MERTSGSAVEGGGGRSGSDPQPMTPVLLARREFLRRSLLAGGTATVAGSRMLQASAAAPGPVRVLCWSERTEPTEVYPQGISGAIARHLDTLPEVIVRTASIQDPDQGLASSVLDATDVLVWWGHKKHKDVLFDRVADVMARVRGGRLGFIGLHSAHWSKMFKSVLECTGNLGGWRHGAGPEHLKVVAPSHPIARGISDFTIPETEMYNEPFDVPPPEKVVFFSYWATGEQFRSGCTWTVGKGRVFYFRPGHETDPVYFHKEPLQVVANAVQWCAHRT